MESLTSESVVNFLYRFRAFTDQLTVLRLQQFESDFGRLGVELAELQAKVEERNKAVASGFNIFRLLSVAHKEVNTHSALLADFLNPDGRHGQKHLFLDSFLQVCKSKHQDFPLPRVDITSGRWIVEKEKATFLGNMDLVISCPNLKFLLVIENKIEAFEQPDQLKRYADWMEGRKGSYVDQALIYLTPKGVQSHTGAGCHYFTLSYHDDIRAWLNASLLGVKAPRVREIIAQYVEIVEAL